MSEKGDGHRLYSFREGDRYEYLAVYALTRIAFVAPVPRPEDFGVIDLHCVLTRKERNDVIPSYTFNVQVKSDVEEVTYQSKNIAWISAHMDCPLFICSVKRGHDPRIRLFSCMNIWSALFFRSAPKFMRLHLKPSEKDGHPFVHAPGKNEDGTDDIEGAFDVYLGAPILDMPLSDFEEKSDEMSSIIEPWIRLDRLNSAMITLGRAASIYSNNRTPNASVLGFGIQSFARLPNQHGLVDKMCLLLDSLAASFDQAKDSARAQMTREFMGSLLTYAEEQRGENRDQRTFAQRLVSF